MSQRYEQIEWADIRQAEDKFIAEFEAGNALGGDFRLTSVDGEGLSGRYVGIPRLIGKIDSPPRVEVVFDEPPVTFGVLGEYWSNMSIGTFVYKSIVVGASRILNGSSVAQK